MEPRRAAISIARDSRGTLIALSSDQGSRVTTSMRRRRRAPASRSPNAVDRAARGPRVPAKPYRRHGRYLRRLIAVELKLEPFQPAHVGQMELYLRWLDKHERAATEESQFGLILYASTDAEQVELLQLNAKSIRVSKCTIRYVRYSDHAMVARRYSSCRMALGYWSRCHTQLRAVGSGIANQTCSTGRRGAQVAGESPARPGLGARDTIPPDPGQEN